MSLEAARTTLQKKGSPSTEEGRDAQRSMESRQRTAERELTELLDKLFAGIRVFQAGGQEAVDGNDLADRINRAAKSSATDDKSLPIAERKRLQIVHAKTLSRRAKLVKLADKICNLRDMAHAPPAGWGLARRQDYFDWAKQVIDEIRGVHPTLERIFDEAYTRRPTAASPEPH